MGTTSATQPARPSSVAGGRMRELLPDALADVLGQVVAEIERDWRREFDRLTAESRAVVADLRAENIALRTELKEHADRQTARVAEALAGVKDGKDGADGRDGKDIAPEAIAAMVEEAVAAMPVPKDGRDGQDGKDGADADSEAILETLRAEVRGWIAEAIEAHGAAHGSGPDGAEVEALVEAAVTRAAAALPAATDTPDVTAITEVLKAEIEPTIRALVADAVAAAAPADRFAVEIAGMVETKVAAAVAALPVPQDGVSLAGAFIDRDGNLLLTLSDGTTRQLGRVVGRDGADVDMSAVERAIIDRIDALPKPKDGLDGVGFDDLDVEYDGERTMTLRFVRGENVKAFPLVLPILIDRGVYKSGETYRRGDVVSWGGSTFIAQADTDGQPEVSRDWRLAVKRGRDGKNGKDGKAGPRGEKGERGEPGPRGYGG